MQFRVVQCSSGCFIEVQGGWNCFSAVQGGSVRFRLLLHGEVSLTDGEHGLPPGAGGQVAGSGLCEVRQLPVQAL